MLAEPTPADGTWVLFLFVAVLYWIPSIVAIFRRKWVNAGSIVVINLFLGWTLIGWVVALAMAVKSKPQTENKPSKSAE